MSYSNVPGVNGIAGQFNDLGECEHNLLKCLKIPISHTMFTGTSEVIIHTALPRAIVEKVLINVTTAEATGTTKTINIGTATADSGDPDGFIAAASVAAVAAVKGAGALVGTICPASDRIVAVAPNAFSEMHADVYIFYTEI
ncbi:MULTISPECIES: hypothetical protein [unclassified Dehalobacter]|uniref:hypothetical protein n=1 Tax=unclassified Dehalobacter TaxID=2635733 RepID=UPI000E6BA936|nr:MULTISPECIES: hypothetical protein [unclassified Dehalobacter]RJE47673.1 hypothetical protein A7K50_03225 [Dehalobacter sp. MCB1]TCX53832.1 hypothetical protein C1I36_03620 [Dehalobacter sp. 14DCB1]